MAKDWGLEWRLVPAKARESCRWQSVDGAWVSVTLGHQKDITKIVVADSEGRTEVVDGYEEGLNVARRWRSGWAARGGDGDGAALLAPVEESRSPRGSGLSGERARPPLSPEGRRSTFSRPTSEETTDPGMRLAERSGTGRTSPGLPRASGSRPDLAAPLLMDDPSFSWSASTEPPAEPTTRSRPRDAGSASAAPPRSSPTRRTPARPSPDLSRTFPAGPRPSPAPRPATPAPKGPGRPLAGGSDPPGRPTSPTSRTPFQELRGDQAGSRTAPPARSPSGPPGRTSPEDHSARSTHFPLSPLVPERTPSGSYPVLERTDHGDDPPGGEEALSRLRRLSRPPRR